jgi:hypothetical protein
VPIVIDPDKQITDPVLLSALSKQGINWRYVELYQDYAPAYDIQGRRIKGRSPYAKFYRHTDTDKRWMVVSQLPMVNADGVKVQVGWDKVGAKYVSKVNQFQAEVSGNSTTITCINDQPTGQRQGDSLIYTPHLYLDGKEIFCSKETLLAIDPINVNYQNNVLEWDYGICKRRLRLIEGKILGTWVFPQNPNGEIRIHYDQQGDFKLHLGKYAISDNEELIPTKIFENPIFGYPFTISDSLTFYPDAHPETTSVDGLVGDENNGAMTWANIRNEAGSMADDSGTANGIGVLIQAFTTSNTWHNLYRGYTLFDTSSLPDNAVISAATVSGYGSDATNGLNLADAKLNVFSGVPASNTALAATDFAIAKFGSTAYCDTGITYANWSTAGYNDFALNATGIAAISLTGITKFGWREQIYDAAAGTPAWTNNAWWYCRFKTSEVGAGYKPKLVVTYTIFELGAASLSGAGTLTTAGKRILKGTASASGIGTLIIAGATYTLGAASLLGIGTLTAIGEVIAGGEVVVGAASLSGIGSLTASALSLGLPVAITQTESNVEQTTATINGRISDDGGESCEARFRYRPIYVEEQTAGTLTDLLYTGDFTRGGQKLTISGRTVTKLAFYLKKAGSPTGDITFTIRKVSDDSIIASKVWGDASALTTSWAWAEKELDTPVYVNEEVRILVEFAGGNISNCIATHSGWAEKADENFSKWQTTYTEYPTEDNYYRYYYGAWITTDWQNTLETDNTYHEDLTDLGIGTEYEYQTQAKNSVGEGEWSSSETFTTKVIEQGATSISGIGTLSISGKVIRSGKGSLEGVGSLSITGKLIHSGTSSIMGVGSLTVAGATSTYASASLQGVGTLTAIGKAGSQILGASALEGIGTLSSPGSLIRKGASPLSGVGTLTIISEITRSSAATLEGIGNLAISAYLIKSTGSVLEGIGNLTAGASVSTGLSGEAILEGVGTLSTIGKRIFASISSPNGEGTLISEGRLTKTASSNLQGAGSLTILTVVYKNAKSNLQGAGTLITASHLILGGFSTLEGVGSLTGDGQIIGWIEGEASLEGIGTLTISARLILSSKSSLEGVGLLTITASRIRRGASNLEGIGSLTVSAILYKPGAANLQGTGSLITSAHLILAGVSAIEGVGTLVASGEIIGWIEAEASLEGVGTLSTRAVLTLVGASSLQCIGTLTADGTLLRQSAQAQLSGVGSLSIIGSRIFRGTSALTGVGTLTISARVSYGGASSLEGIGTLTATLKEINFGSASLSGIGTLLLVASLLKRGTASLDGVGSLGGEAIVLRSGRVVIIGTGTLVIGATLLLKGQAAMLGVGTLTAMWTEFITRHQDAIWKLPDRDLAMAIPSRNSSWKLKQDE